MKKENTSAKETAEETANPSGDNSGAASALQIRESENLADNDMFDLAYAELHAELQESILSLGVQKITSPTDLLPSKEPLAQSDLFDLTDCFIYELQDGTETKPIIMFVIQMRDTGEVLTVGQGINASRNKFVNAFSKARTMNASLTMTNLRFFRMSTGGRNGNFPIIIQNTKDTKPLLSKK